MGTDMKKIINLLEDAAIQKQNDLELYQLRLLLKTFEEHSWKGNYSLGKWKISNGGYDLWFEVYYNETMVLQCVDGLVTANAEIPINQKEVLHCVLEEYRNVKARYKRIVLKKWKDLYSYVIDINKTVKFYKNFHRSTRRNFCGNGCRVSYLDLYTSGCWN